MANECRCSSWSRGSLCAAFPFSRWRFRSGAGSHAADGRHREAHRSLIQPPVSKSRVAGSHRRTFVVATQTGIHRSDDSHSQLHRPVCFCAHERDKVPHAPLASDAEFVRRAYLDATGASRPPTSCRRFSAARDPDKRDRLIDQLTTSDAFVDQWSFLLRGPFPRGRPHGIGSEPVPLLDSRMADNWIVRTTTS